MKLFYILENYEPKGAIEGYPLEVVDRMIHEQVKQGNFPNVYIFEEESWATVQRGGFDWHLTGNENLWIDIFRDKNFKPFFRKYENQHITQKEYDEVNSTDEYKKRHNFMKEAFENVTDEAKEREEKAAREYDFINPEHYKSGSKEVWEMMLDIWGPEKFIAHCEMTAFKYRMRLGRKPNQPIERDLQKAKWYEDKANELKTNK